MKKQQVEDYTVVQKYSLLHLLMAEYISCSTDSDLGPMDNVPVSELRPAEVSQISASSLKCLLFSTNRRTCTRVMVP